ncbi:MAG: hypothetical protein JWP92_3389 [Caulobacter sp.]|nr:hypothetical protein [Caulobacter sp.]
MSELARLLLLVAIAGSAVTVLGSGAIWFMDEDRRIRRALRHVLKSEPDASIVARGRAKGAGFSFATGLAAVAWDAGAWCLVYRLDELMGAELIVDGQVIGRVFRGEARRAIDHVVSQAAQVTLRLIFDDPRHADFALDLWLTGDERRRESPSPADAIQEANRWLARAEAIVRRPIAPRAPAAEPTVAPTAAPLDPVAAPTERLAPATAPLFAGIDDGDVDDADDTVDPPWELDPDQPLAPLAEPPYKPVSKAARPPRGEQDELPFDLDDDED